MAEVAGGARLPPRWAIRLNIMMLRLGVPVGSQRVLSVAGRTSGKVRRTPVSIVTVDARRYVVAALSNVDWVRNARAAGTGVLSRGRTTEYVRIVELPVPERGPILRAFLEQVPGGVRYFGVSPDPDTLAAEAESYPVFRFDSIDDPPSALVRDR
jgi:F420H(2)-dependent quinone reductase